MMNKQIEIKNEHIREHYKKACRKVVDDSCNNPLTRSRENNICPFAYVLRKFKYG